MSGTVDTSSAREFVLAGRVVTSHGSVDTEIHQKIGFDNRQQFVVPGPSVAGNYVQIITQSTEILSTTLVRDRAGERQTVLHLRWPLVLQFTAPPDGTFVSSVSQGYVEHFSSPNRDRFVSNSGQWHDDYPSGTGQAGKQCYFSRDNDRLYSRELGAAGGALTAIVDGQGCSGDDAQD